MCDVASALATVWRLAPLPGSSHMGRASQGVCEDLVARL